MSCCVPPPHTHTLGFFTKSRKLKLLSQTKEQKKYGDEVRKEGHLTGALKTWIKTGLAFLIQ